jgi:hypothetical protein
VEVLDSGHIVPLLLLDGNACGRQLWEEPRMESRNLVGGSCVLDCGSVTMGEDFSERENLSALLGDRYHLLKLSGV